MCGSDYNDAVVGCRTGPMCPGGDGAMCPDDKSKCFIIPQTSCPALTPTSEPTPEPTPGPTSEPTNEPTLKPTPNTPSPTKTPQVCATNYGQAKANCLDMNKHCPTGAGCGAGESCFSVPSDMCGVTDEPTPLPTAKPTQAIIGDTSEAAANKPTTPGFLMVCGEDYSDAQDNCRTNVGCPTGDVSYIVMALTYLLGNNCLMCIGCTLCVVNVSYTNTIICLLISFMFHISTHECFAYTGMSRNNNLLCSSRSILS